MLSVSTAFPAKGIHATAGCSAATGFSTGHAAANTVGTPGPPPPFEPVGGAIIGGGGGGSSGGCGSVGGNSGGNSGACCGGDGGGGGGGGGNTGGDSPGGDGGTGAAPAVGTGAATAPGVVTVDGARANNGGIVAEVGAAGSPSQLVTTSMWQPLSVRLPVCIRWHAWPFFTMLPVQRNQCCSVTETTSRSDAQTRFEGLKGLYYNRPAPQQLLHNLQAARLLRNWTGRLGECVPWQQALPPSPGAALQPPCSLSQYSPHAAGQHIPSG